MFIKPHRMRLIICAAGVLLGLVWRCTAQGVLTNITRGSVWRYDDRDPALQSTNWSAEAFDDSGWSSGAAMLGYEEIGDPTYTNFVTLIDFGGDPTNKYMAAYFRRPFTVPDGSGVVSARLDLRRDDGAIVYINGTEVARNNMPAGPVSGTTPALAKSGSSYNATYWEHFFDPAVLHAGTNTVAVEVHQYNAASSDLRFDLALVTSVTVTPTLVRGPYLQNGTPTQTTIRWRTSDPCDSVVRYGTVQGQLDHVASNGLYQTEHEIAVTNLVPATRYYYAIGRSQGDWAGDDTNHFFQTSPIPGSPKATRVWAIGDSGTSQAFDQGVSSDGSVGYIKSRTLFEEYLDLTADRYTDVWILLGDNAYSQGTDEQYQAGFFDKYPELLRQTVCWASPGNHEFYNGLTSSPLETGPYYDIFSPPTQGEAGGVASQKEAYYSFDFANIHFISLDSHGTDRRTNGLMYAWLENDLASTLQEWIIAFWHHPPYTKGSHNSDSQSDSSGRMFQMRERFLPLIEQYGVDLVLNGHSHSYERSHPVRGHYGVSTTLTPAMVIDDGDGREDGDGAYLRSGGTGIVYTVCGSSGKIGSFNNNLDHPVMVTSMWEHGSVILDVAGTRLDARFLDDEGVVRDWYTILHDVTEDEDTDDDGLPDWWEKWYLGDLSQDGDDHADADGVSNGDEYKGGTDPDDSNSYLQIDGMARTSGGSRLALSWNATPGQRYSVKSTTNLLASPPDWQTVQPTSLMVTVRGTLELQDPALTNTAPAHYYRLTSEPMIPW